MCFSENRYPLFPDAVAASCPGRAQRDPGQGARHVSCPCWGGRPPTASMCQNEVVARSQTKGAVRDKIIRIGIDTSKSVFVLHGVDAASSRFCARSCGASKCWSSLASWSRRRSGLEACGAATLLGSRAAGAGARGRSAAAAIREAVREAEQERCRRRRGDLRGHEPADDAVRAGEDGGAASRADAGGHA